VHDIDLLDAASVVADLEILRPCIGPTVFVLGGDSVGQRTFDVEWTSSVAAAPSVDKLTVRWDVGRLQALVPGLSQTLAALPLGKTPLRERAVEFAGYGLAICAVAAFLPGRVVTHMNQGSPPDLWLALSEDRGVEVAGRNSGRSSYLAAIGEKRNVLKTRVGLLEAYISVWAFDEHVGHKERVR